MLALCHALPFDLARAAPEPELSCLLKRASHIPHPAKQQGSGDLSGKTVTQVKEGDVLGGCLTILPTPGKESIKKTNQCRTVQLTNVDQKVLRNLA